MLTRFDYKMLSAFLAGTIVGCGIHEAIHRLWLL